MELARNKPAVWRTRDAISVTADNKTPGAAIYYCFFKTDKGTAERDAEAVHRKMC